jgi:antitoxin CptB
MELAKLKWQCRRGSLELDLLLQHYLDNSYLQADSDEQERFVALLQLEDEALLTVFTNQRLSADNPPL